MSYSSFMARTQTGRGVPRTFMISSMCVMLVSPINRGSPLIISRMTQPADQMSTWVEYCVAPKMSQGALQHRAQIYDIFFSSGIKTLADPKSQMAALLPFSSKFQGLISLWQMFRECRQDNPLKSWQRMIFFQRLGILPTGQLLILWYRFYQQYRMVMLRYSFLFYRVMQVLKTSQTKSLFSTFTIYVYLFLQRLSWRTRLTATIYLFLRRRPRNTFPNVPSPTCSRSQTSSVKRDDGVEDRLISVFIFCSFILDLFRLLPSLLFDNSSLRVSLLSAGSNFHFACDFCCLPFLRPFFYFSPLARIRDPTYVCSFLGKALESTGVAFSLRVRLVVEVAG